MQKIKNILIKFLGGYTHEEMDYRWHKCYQERNATWEKTPLVVLAKRIFSSVPAKWIEKKIITNQEEADKSFGCDNYAGECECEGTLLEALESSQGYTPGYALVSTIKEMGVNLKLIVGGNINELEKNNMRLLTELLKNLTC